MDNLDDVLNGEVSEVAQPEAETPTETEPTGEKQDEVTPPEPASEPQEPSVDLDELKSQVTGLQAALKAERQKRQEVEQKPAPDVFEDQSGFVSHIQQQMSQMVLNERLNLSQHMAKQQHSDLDAKVAIYKEMVQKNPALEQEVMSSPSPYHEIVNIVDKAQELEQMKDIDSYKAKIRAEIEAEFKAKHDADAQAKAKQVASIPPSLATEQSASSIKPPEWSGPDSLESLFD